MALETVTVVISKQKFSGWETISIDWSYEDAAMSFSLTVSEPDWSPEDMVPFIDEEIEIYAGADLMLTGYIDDYVAEIDAEGDAHGVTISGRSKGADAIDSHARHPTGRIENKTLVDAANELAQKTGIATRFSSDISLKKIAKIQLARHDKVFAAIEREARKQGAILTPKPDGTVAITRPGGQRHAGQLVEGAFPFKGGNVHFSRAGQHSPIVVRGQRALGTDAASLRIEHVEIDATVKRVRPKIVHLEGDGDIRLAKKRGAWEKLRQAAKGKEFSPRLSSWRDSAGKLWTPGLLIACTAPRWHVRGDMLIKSVNFGQDLETGTVATQSLVDPRALGGKKPAGSSGANWGAGGDAKDLED
jgi:prophage tail gpP-like protein